MKLKTKIKIFSVLFIVITIALTNMAIYYLFYHMYVDAEIDRVNSETTTIMKALSSNEDVDKNRLLKAYVPTNGMIRIINEHEEVLHLTTENIEFNLLSPNFVQSETVEIISDENKSTFAVVSVPFIWNNGEVVTLQVVENLQGFQKTMSMLFLVLVVASLIMIIPALVGAQILGNVLLKRIQVLIKSMKENQQDGKWQKIELPNQTNDELYQLGKTYNEMIDRLKDSFERQEQFISDASHELKTPISVITSYAQMLERWGKDKPEVFDESIEAIQSEANRMSHMTQQMLTLARQGKETLSFEPIDIIQLSKETLKVFSTTFNRKLRLITNINQLIISCDREQIKQVLYILIDNAIKYSEDEIHLMVEKDDKYVTISVKDFGEGMSEDEMSTIFNRFYRIDKARNRKTGGTGLGLSIAKSLVEAHNGAISVESMEKEGTTFIIKLPN